MIAGLGLIALFNAVSAGLRNVAVADGYVVATRLAQARLAEAGVTIPLAAGETTGNARDYRWRVLVKPALVASNRAGASDRAGTGKPGLTLYEVDVGVSWGVGREARVVRLDTLRLGPPAPQ